MCLKPHRLLVLDIALFLSLTVSLHIAPLFFCPRSDCKVLSILWNQLNFYFFQKTNKNQKSNLISKLTGCNLVVLILLFYVKMIFFQMKSIFLSHHINEWIFLSGWRDPEEGNWLTHLFISFQPLSHFLSLTLLSLMIPHSVSFSSV